MKASTFFAGAAALYSATPALAFPSTMPDLSAAEMREFRQLADKITQQFGTLKAESQHAERGDIFMGTKVETTGEHEYQAPKKGDLRGPCPGLNILANYGYINRSGYDTTPNIILAATRVFNMGIDLATFITGFTAVVAGDVLTLSIGGPPPASLVNSLLGKRQRPESRGLVGSLLGGSGSGSGSDSKAPLGGALSSLLGNGGLVGSPKGLDWSHYRFESDVSPTRNDIWYTNDAASVHIERFTSLFNRGQQAPGKGGYDLTVLTPHRQQWMQNSIATNPYFWSGPFTNLVVTSATYIFTYRLLGNYTTGTLDPFLCADALKSFEGVSGEPGSFKFTYGGERIPENWSRRPVPFTLADFSADLLWTLQQAPDVASIGGNTGKPNSFVGVDVANVTGGVLSAQSLLQGNNALCFGFATVSEFLPDLTRGLLKNALVAVSQITNALTPILAALNCPDLSRMDASYYDQYPAGRQAM